MRALTGTSVVALVSLTIAGTPAWAATYHVPGDAGTIQEAIELTVSGDSVVVAPGTYPENLLIPHGLTLIGTGGPELTVIDGGALSTVVQIDGASNFVIDGFTIRNGWQQSELSGGGLDVRRSAGTIRACHVRDNRTIGDGGGLLSHRSDLVVADCILEGNVANIAQELDGGGIWCWESTLIVRDTWFQANTAHEGGGICITGDSDVTVRRCTFVANLATSPGVAGSAIIVTDALGMIEYNNMVDNATESDDGFSVALYSGSSLFENNIVVGASHHGLQCRAATTACNDVWGSGGIDYVDCGTPDRDFSADPLFCDPTALEFTLFEGSPCAPANSPTGCDLIGAHPVACGGTPVEVLSWGQMKARYDNQ